MISGFDKFPGLAPARREAQPGAITFAQKAQNCDLSGGTILPINGDTYIETGHSGEFIEYRGLWSSNITNPIKWKFGNRDILLYFTSGEWKKKVDGVVGKLGLAQPGAITLANVEIATASGGAIATNLNAGSALPFVASSYYRTWIIPVDGLENEGPMSAALAAAAYNPGDPLRENVVDRPTNPPAAATLWRLYRSDAGDVPRLIGSAAATGGGGATITDILSSIARGAESDEDIAPSGESYQFRYVITWNRDVGGMLDESGPSDVAAISQNNVGVRITRPVSYPSDVVSWNIYRINSDYNPTTEFQLVATVLIATTFFDDYNYNVALGDVAPTFYDAADGSPIIFDEPSVVFEGMVGPHYGMFFGWRGSDLYASEPGFVDAWPVYYTWKAKAAIVAIVRTAGELTIITEEGLQRGIGSAPESFYIVDGDSKEAGVGRLAAIETEHGSFYIAKGGLIAINGSQSRNITREVLGDNYFTDFTSVHMAYFAGKLYMFHALGTLVLDLDRRDFTTISHIYASSWTDVDSNRLVVLDGTSLKAFAVNAANPKSVDYWTGDISLSSTTKKRITALNFMGTGTVTVSIYVEGTLVSTKNINMGGTIRDRRIMTPRSAIGVTATIRIQGTGEVQRIDFQVFESSR